MSQNNKKFERHIEVKDSSTTVIEHLKHSCPELSVAELKLALKCGSVWLTRKSPSGKDKTSRLRRVKKNLNVGDELHLYFDSTILHSPVPDAQLIADEKHYSVWSKPNGMFSQGTKWADHTSIARWVELFGLGKNGLDNRQCFIMHRLDKATQGLIIVAHNKTSQRELTKLFENRKIEKHYLAKVKGQFPSERIDAFLRDDIDKKTASTQILSSVYDEVTNTSQLKLKIDTGRKHQIRKHLAGIGFPIIGDRLYGKKCINNKEMPDLQLKSIYLSFICPFAKEKKEFFF